MPTKLNSILGRLYYMDEYGVWHEFDGIPTIEISASNYFAEQMSVGAYNFEAKMKVTKNIRKLIKEHKHFVNCLNRHIRREKRLKELRRRAMLKWEALHQ